MIQIKTFAFNPFQVNTYVLYNEHKECIIVDAACYSEREKEILTAFIDDNELNLKLLINTHCHVDHILGVHYIKERYNVPFYACPKDQYLLDTSIDHARGYGFDFADVPVIDKEVFTGDTIPFGEDSLSIIEAPGHTKGSILIHSEPNNLLYTGDVLFYGSIGRTDLPGGNYDDLINSIKSNIMPMKDETEVYCGHGPNTSVGSERQSNPFLQ